MAFMQKIQRGQADVRISNYKNGEASTAMTIGMPCCYDATTAADGFTVLLPTAAHLAFPAGLVTATSVAAGDYATVQTYGYYASAAHLGAATTAIGSPLKLVNAANSLTLGVNATAYDISTYKGTFTAMSAYTTAAVAAKPVFINC